MIRNVAVRQVAEWMLQTLIRDKVLYQQEAVDEIVHRFGEQFTYDNQNGNPAISKDVLKAFRAITGDTVVWEKGQRLWRLREKHDEQGRQQH